MVIQKKELVDYLKACMPGIESGSSVLQGADSFVFHDGKIFTYNDSISVTVPITSESLLVEKVEGCVRAEEFFKVINKFPGDEINFTVTENGTWLLKCGKAKAELTLLDFDFESRLKNITPDENNWVDISDDLLSGLGTCKMAGNKTKLSGVYIEGSIMVSTDGDQMNCYTLKEMNLPKFWISDSCVAELLKLKKLKFMQLQGTWAHFKTEDGILFSVKTLQADNFPFKIVKEIIDNSDTSKSLLHAKFPKDLFSAIDRAVSFGMDISDHSAVRLIISNSRIDVSAERSSGRYNEKVAWDEEIKTEFEPFTVYVDAQMMSFVSQRTVEFYLLKGPIRNGEMVPRLLFVTDSSKHLIATLHAKVEE